ncbi:MAG: right-handed parallel beta-helix repeat-containing protein [Oscillospiraceae bacterium]|nr:right-handed parallel beta-helix repeat-containing protein [Oscillospiraceae bacterium]
MKKTTQTLCALALSAALPAALAWYYDVYVNWQPSIFPFAVIAVILGTILLTLFTLHARGERKAGALVWKTLLSVSVFMAVLFGVSGFVNNMMHWGAGLAANIAVPLVCAQILVLFALLMKALGRRALGMGMAASIVLTSALGFGGTVYTRNYQKSYKAPPPQGLTEGRFAPRGPWGDAADFTVSPEGMSIEEARDAVREARARGDERYFQVEIAPGEYNIQQIVFDERDHDTLYSTRREEDEAVLNGGMRLEPNDFSSWEKNENIKVIDLTKLGLGPDDWGKMYSFGAFTTAGKYDGGAGPLPCELFFNGKRQTLARYPNGTQTLKIGKVSDNGDAIELFINGKTVRNNEVWDSLRNPRGGTFEMDSKTAKRAATWAPHEDIWIFGCFKFDWADMSTRVKAFDHRAGTLTTEYASHYGYAQGGTYYFYNVLEELDEPGEWYLDRDNGTLYLWPPEENFDDARIDISLSTETLITGENINNLSFVGLTLQGTRGDGMVLNGDEILIDHCVVRNLAGSAMSVSGYGNAVSNNEIYRVGRRGITIDGGEAATLTPGGSKAVNNLVHDFAEVVMTYQGGVNVYGTGNLAAHNEIFSSPHSAMFFGGNNQVLEYNLIYNVCLETDDAGAIYNGRSWHSAWGSVIRNNVIYDLGNPGRHPCGIYLDDGLAGVTVEYNLLVNVPDSAIAISGRDLEVHGNFVVNAGKPVSYDQRTRNGALSDDPDYIWNYHWGKGRVGWDDLSDSPWQTDIWREAYPKLAAYSVDFADIEDARFAANPAGSSVTGNIFVGPNNPYYDESVLRFSETEPNEEIGAEGMNGYGALPGYGNIPLEKIGRIENWD